jgi:hypothetical protein
MIQTVVGRDETTSKIEKRKKKNKQKIKLGYRRK